MLTSLHLGRNLGKSITVELRYVLWEITKASTVFEGEGFSSTVIVRASQVIQPSVQEQCFFRVSSLIKEAGAF